MRFLTTLGLCLCAAVAATAADVRATVVRFTSNVGTFDVDLFDADQPATVANFLSYVTSDRYVNSIVHRSAPGFVIQGGGYYNDASLSPVPVFPPIAHEAQLHSNVRGTLAMARTSDPNSATSQWFINLTDNSASLDTQFGGYVVFGQVVGSGMTTVDAIAAFPRYRVNDAITDLPLAGDGSPIVSNLVSFSSVSIVPEPTFLATVVVGVICVATRRRRRHDA